VPRLRSHQVTKPDAIIFDSSERWELTISQQPHRLRDVFDWDEQYFRLLPVALHEVGHVLGLSHSDTPGDVMAPFYDASRVELTDNDVARMKNLLGVRAPQFRVRRQAALQPDAHEAPAAVNAAENATSGGFRVRRQAQAAPLAAVPCGANAAAGAAQQLASAAPAADDAAATGTFRVRRQK